MVPMHAKNVLITGANSGIGKALAILHAQNGANLYLTCRNDKTGAELREYFDRYYPHIKLHILTLDLNDLVRVKDFLDTITALNIKLDRVILSAGIHIPNKYIKTTNGFELHYQVNFLTDVLILNTLHATGTLHNNTTIAYITSAAHKLVYKPFAQFNAHIYNYAYSKFCGTTYFLQYQDIYPDLRIKIIHPGLVETNINRYKSGAILKAFHVFRKYISPEEAVKKIQAILSDENSNQIYWEQGKPAFPDTHCYDYTIRQEIWNKTIDQLRNFLPENRQVKLTKISNFSETFVSLSAHVQQVTSSDQIQKIVQDAVIQKKNIKVIGAKHSYNDGFDSKQILLSLSELHKVVHIDKKNLLVTCQAGITINKLAWHLRQEGLTLPFSGDYGEQTIAGSISTGTHGYYRFGGSLSELVTEMVIIDGKGKIRHITKEEDLRIFCLSLGALGVIYQVTLKVVRMEKYCTFDLYSIHRTLVFNNVAADVYGNAHIKYVMNQYDHNYFIIMKINEFEIEKKRANKVREQVFFPITSQKITHKNIVALIKKILRNKILIKYIFRPLSYKIHHKYYFLFDVGVFINDGIGNIDSFLLSIIYRALKKNKEYDMEIAVPVEKFESLVDLFTGLLKKYQQQNPRFNAFFSARFLGSSDKALLGANYHHDVIFVDVLIYKECREALSFYKDFQEFAIHQCEGKLHWGKLMLGTKEDIVKNYPKEIINTFLAYKHTYDPHNIFFNNYLQRIFGSPND